MDLQKIISSLDHSLLTRICTWREIKALCDEGIKYGTASVCIPPCYVKQAKEYVKDEIQICTVIGFPNGYSTTKSKCFEAEEAIKNGADEIDMVINTCWLKDNKYEEIEEEIRKIKSVCKNHILKVIIETCLLTEEEKIRMTNIVSNSGADFIKTSTGFDKEGAKAEDIELFSKYKAPGLKIKAAGRIRSLEEAERFIELGATRLGTSRIIQMLQNKELSDY